MRKVISFTHATLDGYIDDPHEWSFQYSNDALQDYAVTMTLAADALLLGRCHRRRRPRLPPRLSPLIRTEPPDESQFEASGHRRVLGSCVGSAYMRGHRWPMACGRSS